MVKPIAFIGATAGQKNSPQAAQIRLQTGLWRGGWDSNPRVVAYKLISNQPRYDHFDTAAYFFTTSASKMAPGKRRELMERTEKKLPFDNTPKPLKRQGFFESRFQNGPSFSSCLDYCEDKRL